MDRPVLPPAELTAPIDRPAEMFLGVDDPMARVCLGPDEATFFKALVSRDAALRRWVEEAAQ